MSLFLPHKESSSVQNTSQRFSSSIHTIRRPSFPSPFPQAISSLAALTTRLPTSSFFSCEPCSNEVGSTCTAPGPSNKIAILPTSESAKFVGFDARAERTLPVSAKSG